MPRIMCEDPICTVAELWCCFLFLWSLGFFVLLLFFVLFSDGKLLLFKMCVLLKFGLEK